MKTNKLIISAAWLYEPARQLHKVRDLASGHDYLLTRWGTYKITSADNHFIQGTRVSSGSAS